MKRFEMPMRTFAQPDPLTDAELDRLGDFLESCNGGNAMNVEQLDGFFAALIAGPETVMPSEYNREVFGGDMPDACEFSSLDARDLRYTPVHLHYNIGLHTSINGRAFAALIERLLQQWPIPLKDFVILTHSMGGLVARSAYYYGIAAGQVWPQRLRKLIFLGTPHHGALLERGGNWVNLCLGLSPYTAPFARLGNLRSAGITDLRYGNLLDEDWQGLDRFEHAGDSRRWVPLPKGVRCYAIAANVGRRTGDLFGDGMVPVNSALGRHEDAGRTLSFAQSRQWIGYGMNHWNLLSQPSVYEHIRRWIASPRSGPSPNSAKQS